MKTHIKIGIDEAWRWPWAGPVIACALAFNANNMPKNDFIHSLVDSKKLSSKKRKIIYDQIITLSWYDNLYFWVWYVDNFFIDQYGIKEATKEAMRRSIQEISRKIPSYYNNMSVLIDGNDNFTFQELNKKPIYVIWGDVKIAEISAASIVAKVFRDKVMQQYDSLYPDFNFWSNAWYGTKFHTQKLKNISDISGIHRTSYKPVKHVLERKEKILIHICCGPDAIVPFLDLKHNYDIIAYWYNPNIQPYDEYKKRYEAFVKVCQIEQIPYITWEYNAKDFFQTIKWLEHTPEKGEKCFQCYDMRLERTAKLAYEMNISLWTSSLNNSPHKDIVEIYKIGETYDNTDYLSLRSVLSLSEKKQFLKILWWTESMYHAHKEKLEKKWFSYYVSKDSTHHKDDVISQKLEFLKIAFRKNGWFQRSVDYTIKNNIFRQSYCGCVYSDTFPKKRWQTK